MRSGSSKWDRAVQPAPPTDRWPESPRNVPQDTDQPQNGEPIEDNGEYSEADPSELSVQVAECLPVLGVLSEQLSQTARQVEDAIVGVCGTFQSIARRARAGSDEASALLGDSSGKGERNVLAIAGAVIEDLMTRMGQLGEFVLKTEEKLRQIESIGQRVTTISKQLNRIDKIASGLHMLAMNAKIEATRAGQFGTAFGVVASETSELAKEATQASKTVRELVDELRKDVSQKVDQLAEELVNRAEIDRCQLETSRDQARHALEQLGNSQDAMRERLALSQRQGEELADDVAQAIVALQFQDAVSQRVAHVVEALGELETILADHLPPGVSPNPEGGSWADRLLSRYTMQAERQTLALATGAEDSPAGASPGSIELF